MRQYKSDDERRIDQAYVRIALGQSIDKADHYDFAANVLYFAEVSQMHRSLGQVHNKMRNYLLGVLANPNSERKIRDLYVSICVDESNALRKIGIERIPWQHRCRARHPITEG